MTKRLIDECQLSRRLRAQARHMRQILGGIRLWTRQLWITRVSRRLWWTTRMGAIEGICSVEIKNKYSGFFAQLTWCLCILQHCERHGLVPDIRLTGDVYIDRWRGPNWLDYYFDVRTPMIEKGAAKRVRYTRKIKNAVTAVPVYSHEDHYRSSDGQPVHAKIGQGSGYKKGEDALMNALLLSKCSSLIRTSSFLSAWAAIFNPGLKVILLNKPYPNKFWFPESEIFNRSGTEYFPERPHDYGMDDPFARKAGSMTQALQPGGSRCPTGGTNFFRKWGR